RFEPSPPIPRSRRGRPNSDRHPRDADYISVTGEQQPNGRLCVTLSPTDLTLLYEACRRCFYGKVRLGQPPPRTPMTTLWNRLDQLEKARFVGAPASLISPTLRAGTGTRHDVPVRSAPI